MSVTGSLESCSMGNCSMENCSTESRPTQSRSAARARARRSDGSRRQTRGRTPVAPHASAMPVRAAVLKRCLALALALALVLSGLPQAAIPALSSLTGSAPEVFAAEGDVVLDKTARWAEPKGEGYPVGEVTLSVKGSPSRSAADVVIMLDRNSGIITGTCIEPTHYRDIAETVAVNYQMRTESSGWVDVEGSLTVIMTVHKPFADQADDPIYRAGSLSSLKITGYEEEYDEEAVVEYRGSGSVSPTWYPADWADVNDGVSSNGGTTAVRKLVRDALGSADEIKAQYPFFTESITDHEAIEPPDVRAGEGCKDPLQSAIDAAKTLAGSLINETDENGEPVDNRVALMSFGPSSFSDGDGEGLYVEKLVGFGDAAAWSQINYADLHNQVATGDNRHEAALQAAKYYFVKDGGYEYLEQIGEDDWQSLALPTDYPTDGAYWRDFENAVAEDPSFKKAVNEGVVGAHDNNRAPYIVMISSPLEYQSSHADETEYTGYNVNTSGIVMHGVGFELKVGPDYSDNLISLIEGIASDEFGNIIDGGNYFGHATRMPGDPSSYKFNKEYKGEYYKISTGQDFAEAFAQMPKTMRAAGYDATVTDVIADGFVLDDSRLAKPADADWSYDRAANTITWKLATINDEPSTLTYYIKQSPVDPQDPNSELKPLWPDDPSAFGEWAIETNKSADISYTDPDSETRGKEFPEPELPLERIVYSVEYYKNDDYTTPVDVETRDGYASPVDPRILFDQSLVDENKYADEGYVFVEPDTRIPMYMGDGDVLSLYYTKSPRDDISYEVEYWLDGELAYEEKFTVPSIDNSDTVPIDKNLFPRTYEGGDLVTEVESIPDRVKNGDVIRLDYLTGHGGESKKITYAVWYYEQDGVTPPPQLEPLPESPGEITVTVHEGATTVPFLESLVPSELEDRGLVFEWSDPDLLPDEVADGNVIKAYYKRDEGNKTIKYKIDYLLDDGDGEGPRLADTRSIAVLVGAGAKYAEANREYYVGDFGGEENPLVLEKYPGYGYTGYAIVPSDDDRPDGFVGDGDTIEVMYKLRPEGTKTLKYRVDYYVGAASLVGSGMKEPVISREVTVDAPANEDFETYTVQIDPALVQMLSDNLPQDGIFEAVGSGLELIEWLPNEFAAPTDIMVGDGGIVSLLYGDPTDPPVEVKSRYEVRYMRQILDSDTGEFEYELADEPVVVDDVTVYDGVILIDPSLVSGPAIENRYPGYKLSALRRPAMSIVDNAADHSQNFVEVFYDIDYGQTHRVGYTVEYWLIEFNGTEWLYDTALVTRDIWDGLVDETGAPKNTLFYDRDMVTEDMFAKGESQYYYKDLRLVTPTEGGGSQEKYLSPDTVPEELTDGSVVKARFQRTPSNRIKYRVEFYKEATPDSGTFYLDPDESYDFYRDVEPSENSFTMTPDDRLPITADKNMNGFTYIKDSVKYLYLDDDPAADPRSVLDAEDLVVYDGTVIKVYFAGNPNEDDTYAMSIKKYLLDEAGDLIDGDNPEDMADWNREFRVMVTGYNEDVNGEYFTQNVYVKPSDDDIVIRVPKDDIYTITEYTTDFGDEFAHLETLTPGNSKTGLVDLTSPPEGGVANVAVINKRTRGDIPGPAEGTVKVNKYIFEDARLIVNHAANFNIELYEGSVVEEGAKLFERNLTDAAPQIFGGLTVPGTYTVRETLDQVSENDYAIIGVYDADLWREDQPRTGDSLTFDLEDDKGKSVVILNQYGSSTPPPDPDDYVKLTLHKLLLGADGRPYDGDPNLFGIYATGVEGPAAEAGFNGYASLAGGQSQTLYVPRGKYIITELTPEPQELYRYETTITSDTEVPEDGGAGGPFVSDGVATIDMTAREQGHATAVNTRLLDTPRSRSGTANVTKYVFGENGEPWAIPEYAEGVSEEDLAALFYVRAEFVDAGGGSAPATEEKSLAHAETVTFEAFAGEGEYSFSEINLPDGFIRIGFVNGDDGRGPGDPALTPKDPIVAELIEIIADPEEEPFGGVSLLLFNKKKADEPVIPEPTAVKYTVERYKDGVLDASATELIEGETTDEDGLLAIDVEAVINSGFYAPDFVLDRSEYVLAEGSEPAAVPGRVANGSVIRVYYRAAAPQPIDVTYTIERYRSGVLFATETATGSTLADDGLLAIDPAAAINENMYAPGFEYERSEYIAAAGAEPAAVTERVANGSVIRVYYKAVTVATPPPGDDNPPPGGGSDPTPAPSQSATPTAAPTAAPGGGGGSPPSSGGSTVIDPEDIPEAPIPEGFLAAHIQYINGYPEGDVRPDNDITRAETAAILFRLLDDDEKGRNFAQVFPDVAEDAWYAQSVKYLNSRGIIRGYPEGHFAPDNPITRAEFATMISGFDNLLIADENNFPDIEGHWAVGYINSAAEKGWVAGYPDGTFQPENFMTRAEIVTVINRMLHRRILVEDIPEWAPSYTDITDIHWAYTNIIEASIGHEFDRKENDYEIWTAELDWSPVLES